MAARWDIEIRPESTLSPKERATARDSFVREFERQFSDWSSIASCCLAIERDKDWEVLGYSSFDKWLMNAAPRSKSYLRLVMGRYKELIEDIPEEELAQIPLGSAGVLRKLSPTVRRDTRVRQAAKEKPQRFLQVLHNEFPSQHMEMVVEKKLRFTLSQWQEIERAYEAYKVADEYASLEDFIEFLVTERD